jgi:hypothetical protein
MEELIIPDNVSKLIYRISSILSLAIANPMKLSLEEREEWLTELKETYIKKFNKEFVFKPKKKKFSNMWRRSSNNIDNIDNIDNDIDTFYGINDYPYIENSSEEDDSLNTNFEDINTYDEIIIK